MSGLSCYVPRKCSKLRKGRFSNAHVNVNPARGRGRGMRERDLMPRTVAPFGLLIVGCGSQDESYMCNCIPSNNLVCVIGINASRE